MEKRMLNLFYHPVNKELQGERESVRQTTNLYYISRQAVSTTLSLPVPPTLPPHCLYNYHHLYYYIVVQIADIRLFLPLNPWSRDLLMEMVTAWCCSRQP